MKIWLIALILVVLGLCSAGCLTPAPPVSPPQQTPLPSPTPAPENTIATVPPGDMALQLTDLPSDYLLKDRTVVAFSEVSPLARGLGWRQGYAVMFYRMDREKEDLTGIRQSISVFPMENIDKVYDIETEGILSELDDSTRYEIPFPKIGDQSIAFRETRAADSQDLAVYTVIFTKKNVFETITMGGTTTDYETLKTVVRKAAEKIQ